MEKKSKFRIQNSKTYHILGTRIHNLTLLQSLDLTERLLSSDSQHYIVTPNPEIVLLARKNPRYRAILNKASLSIPDGIGLVWASKRLYGRNGLRERVAGVDFMQGFLRNLSQKFYWSNSRYNILLLGGKNGSAHRAVHTLQKTFPNLKFFAVGNTKSRHLKFIINEVVQPHCIFVMLGAPKQEIWIARNLSKMPSVRLAMGIGGAADMISGKTPRAPYFLRKRGLEWLWRVILQPARMPRIFQAVVVFPLLILVKGKF